MPDRDELRSILNGAGKRPPVPESPVEDAEAQVDVGPCGWVWVKGCRALDVERGAEPVVSFQFVYLGVMAEFTPTRFWVEFVGETTWRLTVEGRNLRALYDRLQDHCLRRIRRADRDFGEDNGKPFVTVIKVEEVKKAD